MDTLGSAILCVACVLAVNGCANSLDLPADTLSVSSCPEFSECTIFDAEADSNTISVALQYDKTWGDGHGKGFVMSLYYIDARMADMKADAVFENKTWDELADYKVEWGKLKDQEHAVSIGGLKPGTPYSIYTVTREASTNKYLGNYFSTISTKP